MAKVSRVINAKVIVWKAGRKKEDWVHPKLESLLRIALPALKTIGDRHYPRPTQHKQGDTCLFVNRIVDKQGNGVLMEVCSYTSGLDPEAFVPDFAGAKADILASEIKGPDGKRREIAVAFRVLTVGDIMLIESVKGSGGSAGLRLLLVDIIRRHVDAKHPSFVLMDVASTELEALIKKKGGVKKAVAHMAIGAAPPSGFAGRLSRLGKRVSGADKISVAWTADDGELSAKQALAMLTEAEDSALDNVTLYLNENNEAITDLGHYREKHILEVQLTGGNVAVNEIQAGMIQYLNSIRGPSKHLPFKLDGTLRNAILLGQGN